MFGLSLVRLVCCWMFVDLFCCLYWVALGIGLILAEFLDCMFVIFLFCI